MYLLIEYVVLDRSPPGAPHFANLVDSSKYLAFGTGFWFTRRVDLRRSGRWPIRSATEPSPSCRSSS